MESALRYFIFDKSDFLSPWNVSAGLARLSGSVAWCRRSAATSVVCADRRRPVQTSGTCHRLVAVMKMLAKHGSLLENIAPRSAPSTPRRAVLTTAQRYFRFSEKPASLTTTTTTTKSVTANVNPALFPDCDRPTRSFTTQRTVPLLAGSRVRAKY